MDMEISDKTLTLTQPLREISNKRATYLASLDGESVIVKGFYAKSHKYYQRERQMHEQLAASFSLPKILLHTDSHPTYSGGVLVYEYIDAQSIGDICQNPRLNTQHLFAISKIIRELKRLEEAGISHLDPHLANFLVHDDKVYLLDLSSLVFARQIDNVSAFLAQFPLSSYLELQFLNASQSNQERVKSIYQKRKAQLYKKVLRECSLVSEQQVDKDFLLVSKNITELSENTDTTTQLAWLGEHANIKIELNQNPFFPFFSKKPFNGDLKLLWQSLHWLYLNRLSLIKPLALSHDATTKTCCLWVARAGSTTIQARFSFLDKEEIHTLNKYLSSFGVIVDDTK